MKDEKNAELVLDSYHQICRVALNATVCAFHNNLCDKNVGISILHLTINTKNNVSNRVLHFINTSFTSSLKPVFQRRIS